MVGLAVLGCGRIGRIHAGNLARHPRAKLVAVFDVAVFDVGVFDVAGWNA